MNPDDLTGFSVSIKASTPGQGRPGEGEPVDLTGTIVEPIYVHHFPPPVRVVDSAAGDLALLVRLDEPFAYAGGTWEFCVVTNRYVGESITEAASRPVVAGVALSHSAADDPGNWLYAFAHGLVSVEPHRTSAST